MCNAADESDRICPCQSMFLYPNIEILPLRIQSERYSTSILYPKCSIYGSRIQNNSLSQFIKCAEYLTAFFGESFCRKCKIPHFCAGLWLQPESNYSASSAEIPPWSFRPAPRHPGYREVLSAQAPLRLK